MVFENTYEGLLAAREHCNKLYAVAYRLRARCDLGEVLESVAEDAETEAASFDFHVVLDIEKRLAAAGDIRFMEEQLAEDIPF